MQVLFESIGAILDCWVCFKLTQNAAALSSMLQLTYSTTWLSMLQLFLWTWWIQNFKKNLLSIKIIHWLFFNFCTQSFCIHGIYRKWSVVCRHITEKENNPVKSDIDLSLFTDINGRFWRKLNFSLCFTFLRISSVIMVRFEKLEKNWHTAVSRSWGPTI